jgi:hypothetical protein
MTSSYAQTENDNNDFSLANSSSTPSSSCIAYNPEEKIITITCKSATLTDINNQLKNPDVLHKETTNGVWLLNAGILIEQGATLYINPTDTSWMKIAANGQTAY